MLANSPVFRFVLYVLAVVSQVAAFLVRPVDAEWGQAVQDAANFLGALAGVTAIGNLAMGPQPNITTEKVTRTTTAENVTTRADEE